MPSREDIAEWLREAAALAKQVSRYQHATGAVRSSNETGIIIRKFEKRAAQVEAMRCGTCKWYGDDQRCNRHNGYLFQDEGCFEWEKKEWTTIDQPQNTVPSADTAIGVNAR